MMKRTKTVILLEEDSLLSEIPTTPDGFLTYWRRQFDRIPREHRNNASIETTAVDEWGVLSVVYTLEYTRLETDEEEQERIATSEALEREAAAREQELLKILREKYPEAV